MATNVIHETFKVIKDHESYQISNYGNIFSTKRGRLLKPFKDKKGYSNIDLDNKSFKVHHLVWDNFGYGQRNGQLVQIDHIDNNKQNNQIDNLRLVTTRENCTKRDLVNGSKYNLPTGVTYFKRDDKYKSQIRINGKQKHLGLFHNPQDASDAYQNKLKEVICG